MQARFDYACCNVFAPGGASGINPGIAPRLPRRTGRRRLDGAGVAARMSLPPFLPGEMRVIEITEPGGPEVLRPGVRRVPRRRPARC